MRNLWCFLFQSAHHRHNSRVHIFLVPVNGHGQQSTMRYVACAKNRVDHFSSYPHTHHIIIIAIKHSWFTSRSGRNRISHAQRHYAEVWRVWHAGISDIYTLFVHTECECESDYNYTIYAVCSLHFRENCENLILVGFLLLSCNCNASLECWYSLSCAEKYNKIKQKNTFSFYYNILLWWSIWWRYAAG